MLGTILNTTTILVGSSGISILGIKDIKTVNLLPSLLVPVVFYLVKGLF